MRPPAAPAAATSTAVLAIGLTAEIIGKSGHLPLPRPSRRERRHGSSQHFEVELVRATRVHIVRDANDAKLLQPFRAQQTLQIPASAHIALMTH
jgi:hypothetical protein